MMFFCRPEKGGTFLLNCNWNAEELEAQLPSQMKRYIAANDIKFISLMQLRLLKASA